MVEQKIFRIIQAGLTRRKENLHQWALRTGRTEFQILRILARPQTSPVRDLYFLSRSLDWECALEMDELLNDFLSRQTKSGDSP